jgi:hypothetical protein
MARRWKEELHSHVKPLKQCAEGFANINANRVKAGKVGRLSAGSVLSVNL